MPTLEKKDTDTKNLIKELAGDLVLLDGACKSMEPRKTNSGYCAFVFRQRVAERALIWLLPAEVFSQSDLREIGIWAFNKIVSHS
jgi:hypothetical protein